VSLFSFFPPLLFLCVLTPQMCCFFPSIFFPSHSLSHNQPFFQSGKGMVASSGHWRLGSPALAVLPPGCAMPSSETLSRGPDGAEDKAAVDEAPPKEQ
jgi:hypothetical protein